MTKRREREDLQRRIARKEARKMRALRHREQSIWFGLGMFGVIGWSVAIPTLLGIAIGLWIDSTWPSRFSWTLMLLLAGIIVGCFNAWYWVNKEREMIEAEHRDDEADSD